MPDEGIRFLGLMHGHFDVKNLNEDVVIEDEREATSTGIHTGIGVVIPVHKVVETLEHPELVQMRKDIIAQRGKEAGT